MVTPAAQPHLLAEGLTIGRGRRTLLRGLDLAVEGGALVHVAGENGCGKSSLLRVLAGDVEPRRGRVEARGRRAYVPERMVLPETVPARAWLALLGAADATLPDELDRRCGALSKGQLQRVALAGALHGRPDVLILDEPWAGLDTGARGALDAAPRSAAERGAAVVFTDHSGEGAVTATHRLRLGAERPALELLVPPPATVPQATIRLTRGDEHRTVTVAADERDALLARELAAGWGVEQVETHR
ncbi:MAG: ATP-binding cassette domain-containing protein [Patulibacter minatonensis]